MTRALRSNVVEDLFSAYLNYHASKLLNRTKSPVPRFCLMLTAYKDMRSRSILCSPGGGRAIGIDCYSAGQSGCQLLGMQHLVELFSEV